MKWTWEENKAFENMLAQIPDSPARLQIIADQLGRPVDEVKSHYERLVHDIAMIESGGDVVLDYSSRSRPKKWTWEENKAFENLLAQIPDSPARLEIIADQLRRPLADIVHHYERLVQDIATIESSGNAAPDNSLGSPIVAVKRAPWSPQEHELFLEGLNRFGPGDWEAISRNVVKTKTAQQVRSHGLYYLAKEKKLKESGKKTGQD